MKARIALIVLFLALVSNSFSQTSGSCVTDILLTGYSEKSYTTEPVTDQQLDIILRSGIKAPSARNMQPWKFTVIRDTSAMRAIISNVVPGNILIIVSGAESETGSTPDFDCGLATESMFLAAHGLGLGARIYTGPIGNVNSKGEAFQIPAGYKAVALLRVGNTDKSVDAVTSATPRKNPEEIINYYIQSPVQ
ncbi:MAG: nitroreductase [Bacteroidales bacterium]|nr:nitroreductase [Bacteroidales bacterium]